MTMLSGPRVRLRRLRPDDRSWMLELVSLRRGVWEAVREELFA